MSTLPDRLSAVREAAARVAAARRFLAHEDAGGAVEAIFAAIVRARRARAASALTALDAVAVALTERGGLPYQALVGLYAAAATRDLWPVARLFFTTAAEAASEPPPAEDLEAERPAVPRGSPLPLGHRTWLARRASREAKAALAADPHPRVVESILANPAATEADVIAVASRRPTQPDCQIAIFSSARWRVRHGVKRALALNPHTPVALAARIAVTLRDGDLRDIARDGRLGATLRRHASEVRALGRD